MTSTIFKTTSYYCYPLLFLTPNNKIIHGGIRNLSSSSTLHRGWNNRQAAFGHRERIAEAYLAKKEWTVDTLIAKRRMLKEGTPMSKQVGVNWIAHDNTVLDAVKTMVTNGVGSLLVFENIQSNPTAAAAATEPNTMKKKWVGIITERDYLSKIAVKNLTSSTTKVEQIMTPRASIITCTLDYTLYECLHLFENATFRHLPVVNKRIVPNNVKEEEEEIIAVLSQRDIVTEFRSFHEATVKYLEAFVEFPIW
jgi:CBS domain-containing protein